MTINVKTQPNSFVGLMAVEKVISQNYVEIICFFKLLFFFLQSVMSFTPGHDITMNDVVNELREYDSATSPEFYDWFRVIRPLRSSGGLFWHSGSSGSENVFSESGTLLMTNAHVQPGRKSSTGSSVRVVHHGENRPLGRPLPSPDANIVKSDQGPGIVYETVTR